MKRLISMMLAVMLIATLGVLPVSAAGHTDHFIKFLDSNGQESSTITLPPATVGREYSYTIDTSSCGDFPIAFELGSGGLPDGLTLNTNGTISGIPTTPAEDAIEFLINASGRCPEADAGYGIEIGVEANFYLTVRPAPEMITWRIPYTKQVVRGGSRTPGPQTFTLEIFDVGVSYAADQVTISGDTGSIATNGAGDYPGYVSVTAPAEALDEGFKVREKSGNAAHWTYSDVFYTIWPESGPDGNTFKIYEGEYDFEPDEQPVNVMTFENTYTYSPSHDRDDDDDDDDYDYDPPVREPKEDKEPQPQQDEPKSNPSTGRGTTWDYLVYLFHKYFSWAA